MRLPAFDAAKQEAHFRKKSVHARKTSRILCAPEAEVRMGDWEADWSGDVLERIVALLFALAGLADRAAGLPCRHRRHVLGILGHGEAEARAFLIGVSTGAPVAADASEEAGDAAGLAARLRALALLLCAMLARRFASPGAAGPQAGRRKAVRPAGRQAPARALDTS